VEECEGGKGERGEVGLKQSTECWIEYRVRSSEGGGVALTVQRCKSAGGLWKSGKVGDNQSTECWIEYRVRSAGGARERQLGQHAVLFLPRGGLPGYAEGGGEAPAGIGAAVVNAIDHLGVLRAELEL